MMDRYHDFLVGPDGLSTAAKQLPEVRSFMEELPDTAATFRTSADGLDVNSQLVTDVHMEFLKSWPVHDIYATSDQSGTLYVNPEYIHAHRYTDIVVECPCGAKFTRNYDDEYISLQQEHEHEDDCLPFHRLRARAEMLERRYRMIRRLGWLGWKGSDMASRFGSQSDYMGALARDFGLSLRDCYDKYRQTAAHTYVLLVTEKDASAEDVAEVYGHSRTTMTRWAKQYADYSPEVGRNQFSD